LLIHSKKIPWLKLVSINAAPSFGRLDVLVVENDVNQLSLFTEILALAGFSVHGAAAPDEALTILRSARVDLLVTDIRLDHDMNGFELANQAQSLQPSLQALFVTGLPPHMARRQKGAQPNAPILLKPFSLDDFVNTVSDAQGGSLHVVPAAMSDRKAQAAPARSL
jgi:DNA-binding NtrC family response regulator